MVLGAGAHFKQYEKWIRTNIDMIEYRILAIWIYEDI